MRTTVARPVAVVAVVAVGSLLSFPAVGAVPKTSRVSVRSNGSEANDYSYSPSVSDSGRFVAFSSIATNLVAHDDWDASDVFVHNRTIGKTRRVSLRSNGAEANRHSSDPSISGTGRFVAFESDATNLIEDDENGTSDVFVHDRKTNRTVRVSVNSNGTERNGYSYRPSISDNGRVVAFESNGDIHVHDRKTGRTKVVSVNSRGTEGDSFSYSPSISATGRFVAFESDATNLVANDDNRVRDVFVHDRKTGRTRRVSVRSNGAEGDEISFNAAISGTGRFVAFNSNASNLVTGDHNGLNDVFVHDLETGRTKRVSVRSNGIEGNEDSFSPSISDAGDFVAFSSRANNLVVGDANGFVDVFVHDVKTGRTRRVSVRSNGIEGNGDSLGSSISGSGDFVAFFSYANNLVPGDHNRQLDVFLRGPLD